jgi:hypothetical protein
MTDFSSQPDDEIVSAHLDGEATPDEVARIEGDPRSRERLEQFDAVRAEVAAPAPPDPFAREAALAAALDVFDREVAPQRTADPHVHDAAAAVDGQVSAAPRPPLAPVVDLAKRRRVRGIQLLSAAAAIVVVLAVVGLARVAQRSNDVSTMSANQAFDAAAPTGSVSSKAAGGAKGETNDAGNEGVASANTPTTRTEPLASASPSQPSPTVPPVGPVVSPTTVGNQGGKTVVVADLGPVANRDDLVHRIATEMTGARTNADQGGPTTTPPGAGAAAASMASCDGTLRGADFEIGTLTFEATLTYAGAPAYAFVYSIDQQAHPAANGPARLYVVSPSCQVLDVETL